MNDYIDLKYYLNEDASQDKVGEILINCLSVYNSCFIINNLESIEKANQTLNEAKIYGNNVSSEDYHNALRLCSQATIEWLSDVIKILIVFENYMKCVLILNCFLIHKIKNNEELETIKSLFKKQSKEAIHFNELEEISPFKYTNNNELLYNDYLSEKTLDISTMLKYKYKKHIMLEKEIIEFLKELIKFRNSLHFLEQIDFVLSEQKIKKLRLVDEFIKINIIENISKRK